jgi:hypothetical protein
MLKKALKSGARAVALQAGRLIDSDSATIEINGKTMSGREFQEWRERRKSTTQGMQKRDQQTQRAAGPLHAGGHDDL